MKLLDIMKKYDRCLVRESAKLTKIYNMLLKEAANDGVDLDEMDLDEQACPDCGNDPCTCDETEEFDECGDKDTLIPEEDFIQKDDVKENDMLRNRPHNGHIDDPAGVIPESEFFGEAEQQANANNAGDNTDDDSETMSAAEFFAEAEKEQKADSIIPESDFFAEGGDDTQMMDAEEFFSSDTTKVPPKKNSSKAKEEKNSEKTTDESEKINEQELNFVPAEEWIQQQSEEMLEESLKSYRRKNHHLFNA